ncbi:MAG: hypothetical protein OER88_01560 [Planctomycetota bacterium]|nr:hypothetical protein [Planctomycetota bacterium]
MEALTPASGFRDLDVLVRETFRAAARFRGEGGAGLAERLRDRVVDAGGWWMRGQSGGGGDAFSEAGVRLLEGRWILYVARRCGYCDGSVYRSLSRRFDRAEARLAEHGSGRLRPPDAS